MRVLVVDDDPSVATVCEALRARDDALPRRVPATAADRPALLDAEHAAVVVLGPGVAGRLDLVQVIDGLATRVPVVVVGQHDAAAAAVVALKAGAADYLTLAAPDLGARIMAAARAPEPAASDEPALAGLVGTSPPIQRVRG